MTGRVGGVSRKHANHPDQHSDKMAVAHTVSSFTLHFSLNTTETTSWVASADESDDPVPEAAPPSTSSSLSLSRENASTPAPKGTFAGAALSKSDMPCFNSCSTSCAVRHPHQQPK